MELQDMLTRNGLNPYCPFCIEEMEHKYSIFIQLATRLGMYDIEWHDVLLKGYCKRTGMSLEDLSSDELLDKLEGIILLLNEILDEYNRPIKANYRNCRTILERNPYRAEDVFASTQKILPDQIVAIIIGARPPPAQYSLGYAFGTFHGPSESVIRIHESLTHRVNAKPQGPDGNLDGWITQGVFLINAWLTVRARSNQVAASIVHELIDQAPNTLVMSMGGWARAIVPKRIFRNTNHLNLCHPTADTPRYEYEYLHNDPFMKANAYLFQTRGRVIDWFGYQPERIQTHRQEIVKKILIANWGCRYNLGQNQVV